MHRKGSCVLCQELAVLCSSLRRATLKSDVQTFNYEQSELGCTHNYVAICDSKASSWRCHVLTHVPGTCEPPVDATDSNTKLA